MRSSIAAVPNYLPCALLAILVAISVQPTVFLIVTTAGSSVAAFASAIVALLVATSAAVVLVVDDNGVKACIL